MSEPIYKPGLEGIIAGDTTISSVGQSGLSYRGYDIADLAENTTFEQVAHLLICGALPTEDELRAFRGRLDGYRRLAGEVVEAVRLIPAEVKMMDVLRTGVSFAGHFDPVSGSSEADLRERAIWLTAQCASIVAARYRLINGSEPLEAKAGLSHAGQILYQTLGSEPDETASRLLDLTLILYAEHEFNASTFTNRIIASTLSDMTSAIVGAIGALKGPLHGGANEAAMEMLKQFETPEQADAWLRERFARKEKVMGFGHRVYKNGDHRARILEDELRKLAEQKGQQRWMAIYDAIKEPMVNEKKIFPNVDYPCGLTYYLLDLPIDMYTPLFVCSRVTGWCAHFIEQQMNNRLIRPLSRYTGPAPRTTSQPVG